MPEVIMKNGWQKHRFDEMAVIVHDRVDDPSQAGVERYVGLEHLDPDSLTIHRWGSPDDVGATKLRFRIGDIIFGRRRAYQRKLAVADFDGICSAHAMVLRAKPEVVLPEFLPFMMQSNLFMDRAKEISVGSLSPTINWRTLAQEEFAVPPLEEQLGMVKTLRSATRSVEAIAPVYQAHLRLERSYILEFFQRANETWEYSPFEELGEVQLGQQKHPKYELGRAPKPYLRVVNVGDGYLDLSDVKEMDFVGPSYEKHLLRHGDLLITEGDLISPFNVGRSAMFRGEINECCVQKTLIRFRPQASILPEYALLACRYLRYAGVFAQAATGSTVSHLVAREFKKIRMPVAPEEKQVEAAEFVESARAARALILSRISQARQLLRVIRETVLEWRA